MEDPTDWASGADDCILWAHFDDDVEKQVGISGSTIMPPVCSVTIVSPHARQYDRT